MLFFHTLDVCVNGGMVLFLLSRRTFPPALRWPVLVLFLASSIATSFLVMGWEKPVVYADILVASLAMYISWYIARYEAAPLWMRRMFIGVGMAMGLFLGFELVRLYMSLR